ncbi:hypothetical protein L484_021773 [Morus notabilis]|uniref:Uncharacterized protein n=1 Tax=Morus notabilis TaxID=981085 RepID=W9QSL6_9ROSA|nr:hypothetical protein L484_021773 [Morus notabilis]
MLELLLVEVVLASPTSILNKDNGSLSRKTPITKIVTTTNRVMLDVVTMRMRDSFAPTTSCGEFVTMPMPSSFDVRSKGQQHGEVIGVGRAAMT